MLSFWDWLEQSGGSLEKGWKASKKEILDHWRSLPPHMPIVDLRSIPYGHTGRTYEFDGLRVTGSSAWINYVLSRLKDILSYETEDGKTKLQTIYKQVVDNKTHRPIPQSYVFYAQVHERNLAPKIRKPHRMPPISKIR
jgi:hypothetical protein